MKTKAPLLAVTFAAVALIFAGCASNKSPLQRQSGNTVNGRGALIMGGSAAAGAATGYALSGGSIEGSAIGGAVGLAGGALLNNHLDKRNAAIEDEAYARGARDARVDVMQKYWEEKTLSPRDDGEEGREDAKREKVEYPGGTYESIRYARRRADSPDLKDPVR